MLITFFLTLGVVGCGVAFIALLETSRNAREIKKLKEIMDKKAQ